MAIYQIVNRTTGDVVASYEAQTEAGAIVKLSKDANARELIGKINSVHAISKVGEKKKTT